MSLTVKAICDSIKQAWLEGYRACADDINRQFREGHEAVGIETEQLWQLSPAAVLVRKIEEANREPRT